MDRAIRVIRRPPPRIWEVLLLLLVILLPQMPFMDRSRTSLAVFAGVYVMLGLSLNVIVGYAGLFQLGHAAFFGLGAYTAAILSLDYGITILATIPIAALVAGLAAIIVTKPILHLRGDYLCIVTIAFGEIFRISVTNNIFGITGGSNGLVGAGRPELPLPWLEPVPVITLLVLLGVFLWLTRHSGPALRWGGTALIAVGYYLPPVALGDKPLFLMSMLMVLAAILVAAMLRDYRMTARSQLLALAAVVAAFVLATLVRAEPLVAAIESNLDTYFRVQDPVTLLGIEVTPVAFKRDALPYYYLVLGFIVITIVGLRRLQNSRLGRAWLYVREDQLAAEAMGIDTTQVKLYAFAIGSAWAGVAGVLYTSRFTVVAPESFNFLQSVIMFSIVVLGGSGSIPGVLVGTLGMVVLPELLRDAAPTFLYEGAGPLLIVGLILANYLYRARTHLPARALESGAIALAFFLPPLLTGEPTLYVIGVLMALISVLVAPRVRQRTDNALAWTVGALAVYTVGLALVGRELGPDLRREVLGFRIMDWRDGLMGVAMVAMMVLRPAGIIPEQRQRTEVKTAAAAPELVATSAAQRTI